MVSIDEWGQLPDAGPKIKCLKCNDIIQSMYRHDFKWCSCKNIAVDGGGDYLKMSYKDGAQYEVLAIKTYSVPVTWSLSTVVEVKAETADEAASLVEDMNLDELSEELPSGHAEYVPGSHEILYHSIEEVDQDNLENKEEGDKEEVVRTSEVLDGGRTITQNHSGNGDNIAGNIVRKRNH